MSKPVTIDFSSDVYSTFFMGVTPPVKEDGSPQKFANFTEADLEAVGDQMVQDGAPQSMVDQMLINFTAIADLLDLGAAALGDKEPSESILTVQFNEEGSVVRVYTPAVFRVGQDAALKIGMNLLPLTQNGDKFKIGDLDVRRISYSTAKTQDGLDYTVCFLNITTEQYTYKIKCMLEKDQDLSQDEIEDGIDAGQSFGSFLKPLSQYCLFRDLDIGAYIITDVQKAPDTSAFQWDSFLLTLADGRTVKGLNTAVTSALTVFESNCNDFSEFVEFIKTKALVIESKTEFQPNKWRLIAKLIPLSSPKLKGKLDTSLSLAASKDVTVDVTPKAPVAIEGRL